MIEKKASVNVQNKTGQTPLHMAIEYDYYSIVQALKAAGADDKITNNFRINYILCFRNNSS